MTKLKTILLISAFVVLAGGFLLARQVLGVGIGTPIDMGGRDITNVAGLNATGNVKGGGLCIGTDCKTAWPTAGVASCDACDSRFVNVSGDAVTGDLTVSGNVGIGTISPERKLHISGGNLLLDNTRTLEAKNVAGTIETWMWPRWSDNIMYTNFGSGGWNIRNNASASRVFIQDGGNVGIGTTGPVKTLEVRTTGTTNFGLMSGSGATGLTIQGDVTGLVSFSNQNGEIMQMQLDRDVIISSGNLGIGTASPASKLVVYDGGESTTQTTFTQALANAGIQISTDYTADAFTPGIFWQTSNNNSTRPKAGIYLRETGSGTYMFLGTSNNYSTGITNNAVVIDYSGKVGIGLLGPTQKLDVDGYVKGTGLCIAADCRTTWPAGGDITAVGSMTTGDTFAGSAADDDWLGLGSAAGRIEFDDQATDEVNILSANVGIGTASPNQKLSVSGNVLVGNADGESGYYLGFRGRSDMGVRSNGYSVSVEAPDYVSVNIDSNNNNTDRYFSVRTNGSDYSGGSELFRVQENGNIGIGDTSPAALFTVGSGDLFQVNSSGNLVKINNVTYSWPSSQGAASTYLKNNGSGTLTWETVSTGDNLGNHTATQNLNMSGYQIQNFRIENRTTDPASPAVGQMWICTDAGNSTPCDGI